MIRRPPRSTRTDTLFPSTTLFRSRADSLPATRPHQLLPLGAQHRRGRLGGGCCWKSVASIHPRSEEHTSELQSLMRISYAVFCLKKKNNKQKKKLQESTKSEYTNQRRNKKK